MTAHPPGKLFPIAQCQRRTHGRTRPGDQHRSNDRVACTLGFGMDQLCRTLTRIIPPAQFWENSPRGSRSASLPVRRSQFPHSLVVIHRPSSRMAHPIGRAQVSTLAQKNGNAAVKVESWGKEQDESSNDNLCTRFRDCDRCSFAPTRSSIAPRHAGPKMQSINTQEANNVSEHYAFEGPCDPGH
jgi:hypothetical protein